LADGGHASAVSLLGIGSVFVAFALALFGDTVWTLALAAIALDAGVQAIHIVSQRVVLTVRPQASNRLNSLYIALFFSGGAVGSGIAGPMFIQGWQSVAAAGMAVTALAAVLSVATLPPSSQPIKELK
jgi:predicted MFS family arabinose efflux permease